MSWRNLFKPQDKDPKNIVEWLGLITDDIKKLKNTDNWYDEVSLITEQSIIDNLTTDVGEFALSARQGYLLNAKIGVSDQKISVLEGNVTQLQLDMTEVNNKISDIKNTGITLINDNIEEINNKLEQHKRTLDSHGADINKNKNDIKDLTTRVTKNESDIDSLEDRVSENENNITRLDERTSTSENDINNIKVNIDDIEEDITDLRNVINENVKISNIRIDSLVGDNVKISGLEVKINNENTQLTVSPGKAIIQGKIIEVKSSIVKAIDPILLTRNIILYTLISLDSATNNVVVSLSETDMTDSSLRIHSMIINNGCIIESLNNSNMVPIGSIIGISADKEAANIREQIPSGFTTLGELDYSYMRNNENQVKFKTKSVTYVNGYKIEIPAGVIVNIGKAPEKDSREDLLFLEAWKDVDFSKTGKLKWRIRHVIDIDFNYYYMDGFSAGTSGRNLNVTVQGGRVTPYINPSSYHYSFNRGDLLNFNDVGLYVSSKNNSFLTIDGYVYAIPMFRLYRRPSCGKLEPYDYDKINKLCDYDKVKSLVTSEKVERVISETISGKTILNHCTPMRRIATSGIAGNNKEITNTSFKITTTTEGSSVILTQSLKTLVTNTVYTIIVDVEEITCDYIVIGDRINSGSFINNYITKQRLLYGRNRIKFRTGSDLTEYGIWIGRTDPIKTGSIIHIKNFMILEGDWTGNVYLPKYFEGLSSLGEEEYNLIKVKNGIIHYPTYNPNTGNQKLITRPIVTHINSENVLIPEFTAELKKSNVKQLDVTEFGKLITDGDERLEFTKIKGRTMQNLFDSSSYNFLTSAEITENVDYKVNSSLRYIKIDKVTSTSSPRWSYINCGRVNKTLLKPNTKYTVVFGSLTNIREVVIMQRDSQHPLTNRVNVINNKAVLTTVNDITIGNDQILYIPIDNYSVATTFEVSNVMIIEGDHSSTPLSKLPFIQGIKSVGENENSIINIKSHGKNLFDGKLQRGYWYNGYLNLSEYSVANVNNININQNTTYSFTIENYNDIIYIAELNELLHEIKTYQIRSGSNITTSSGKYIRFCTNNSVDTAVDLNVNIQIEEGVIQTEYHPYKEYKQEIHLKEPLRSLPNKVHDEIKGNKIIRRVGKIILDGSEPWFVPNSWGNSSSDSIAFSLNNIKNMFLRYDEKAILCDVIPCIKWDSLYSSNAKGISVYTNNIRSDINIRMLRSNIPNGNLEGFRTWLSQHPVTVYYELQTPIEEYLENVYDKESIKTYQLDAPLRSLPNGIKDEIKDGVLIRRCGEIILDGSEDEYIRRVDTQDQPNSVYFNIYNAYNRKPETAFLCNTFKAYNRIWHDDIEGVNGDGFTLSFRINKNRIIPANEEGFKKWLKENPTTTIYELSTPIYTKLNEVHINKSEYSINRQFKDGRWLRELPNGVRDTVENGKVVRRVGKMLLTGSENNWILLDTNTGWTDEDNVLAMEIRDIDNLKVGAYFIHDNPELVALCGTAGRRGNIHYIMTWAKGSNLGIGIKRSLLKSQNLNGLKDWLSKNPINVLYELSSPITEELTNNNYMYYPQHECFNTSCASLYVSDGYNNIDILNNIKTIDNIIETPYRIIEGNKDVVDTQYKPSINGKEISFKIPKGKNKINMFDYTINEDLNKVIVYRNDKKLVVSTIEQSKISFPLRWFIRLNPNTTYTISCVIESTSNKNYRFHVYNYSEDTEITTSNYTLNSLTGISSTNVSSRFKTSENGAVVVSFLIATDSTTGKYAPNIPFIISNLQIEEGNTKTVYEEFIPDVRAFENIESNDVCDLRKIVSLTGYNYEQMLNKSFDLLLNGEL